MRWLLDTWLVFRGHADDTIRKPQWLLVGALQPVLYLLLFAPILQAVVTIRGVPVTRTYNVFLPGLLVQLGLFSTTGIGFALIADLEQGVIERLRVTPVSRLALALGRVLHEVLVFLVQAIVLIALAVPFGLDVSLGQVLLVLALLMPAAIFLASTSYFAALMIRRHDRFSLIVPIVTVPMFLLSGILLPMSLAPDWLRRLSLVDPLSYVVDAARAIFAGSLGGPAVLRGSCLVVALAVGSLLLASRALSRTAA